MMLKNSIAARPMRGQTVKVSAAQRPRTIETLVATTTATLMAAAPAFADEVDSTIDSVIGAVKATGELVKSGITTVQAGVQVLKEGYDVAAPIVKSGVDAATPFLTDVYNKTVEVAGPVVLQAAPAFKSTVTDVVSTTGIDASQFNSGLATASKAAGAGAAVAAPVVNGLVNVLTTTDPTTLGEAALGAVAIYYLLPVFGQFFKGYRGECSAATALDAVVTEPSVVLVDIRSFKEKESSGVPDVPGSANSKVIEVEYAALEDKKLRGLLRDPNTIEAQTTALQIASLKRLSKGTKVLLLDRYTQQATSVAKELAKRGYSNVFVVTGGFDGRNGWIQSKLQIKPFTSASLAFASASNRATGTRGTRPALPAPKA